MKNILEHFFWCYLYKGLFIPTAQRDWSSIKLSATKDFRPQITLTIYSTNLGDKALSHYLDIQSLARLVRTKRGTRGLRAIAQECHTSASIISRIEREQIPDISSFLSLCYWLQVSPARFFKSSEVGNLDGQPIEGELSLSKADELALRVRADSRLEPATANVLAVLIQAAYTISTENSNWSYMLIR